MQVFGLPRLVARGAALAARRRDIPERRRGARAHGSSADEAAAVGVSRATPYRRQQRAEPRSRRPDWTPALANTVRERRKDYLPWGKARIAIQLRREGHTVSESTVGRILERLMDQGVVEPVASLRRNAPRAARRKRPCAKRLPKGRKPSRPGEIVQVDGGAEFEADFESECRNRGIDLFELPPRSPQLDGHVERDDGAWRHEFHATWDLPDDDLDRWVDAFADEFDTFRPHRVLGGRTPRRVPSVHRSPRDLRVSHVPNQGTGLTGPAPPPIMCPVIAAIDTRAGVRGAARSIGP